MKDLYFLGDSLTRVQQFPAGARRKAGFALRQVQKNEEPGDWKNLTGIAPGIRELRLWAESGTYRVVYLAKFADAVYVLHAFQKKTEATAKRDLDLVRRRYEEVRASRERL